MVCGAMNSPATWLCRPGRNTPTQSRSVATSAGVTVHEMSTPSRLGPMGLGWAVMSTWATVHGHEATGAPSTIRRACQWPALSLAASSWRWPGVGAVSRWAIVLQKDVGSATLISWAASTLVVSHNSICTSISLSETTGGRNHSCRAPNATSGVALIAGGRGAECVDEDHLSAAPRRATESCHLCTSCAAASSFLAFWNATSASRTSLTELQSSTMVMRGGSF
mmetsp:Transcript_41531/g.90027  ORF Transcript_41531/g.90027 Transcript_41531/m.90027 type:complete len:223 (-) Transcript_41531:1299-1967(-)